MCKLERLCPKSRQRLETREAISLAPWLQPGALWTLFPLQPFQRFSGLSKPLKRLGAVEMPSGSPG
jgi:hypothetical protein